MNTATRRRRNLRRNRTRRRRKREQQQALHVLAAELPAPRMWRWNKNCVNPQQMDDLIEYVDP